MKRVVKWFAIAVSGLAVIAFVAVAVVYVVSERVINRTYDVALFPVTLITDSLALQEGQRLATLRGCYDGCHGEKLNGGVFFDEPMVARVVAPNLTLAISEYSNEELARAIRYGVKRDGKSSMVMPTGMLYHLSDEDLASIISFLRSVPPSDGPAAETRVRLMGRVGVMAGVLEPSATQIDPLVPRFEVTDPADDLARGQYLALTVCAECHGNDLRGHPQDGVPGLGVAAAYSKEAFSRLMQTGIGLGDRELGLMTSVARSRFAHFTEDEVRVMHAYLQTLAVQEVIVAR